MDDFGDGFNRSMQHHLKDEKYPHALAARDDETGGELPSAEGFVR